ncbi:NAD(P)/FAD-dependent oxidoreductase [Streptomyces globosus]|uniref:Pyridine nucleotide-disulfide oxidoreductase domain-containing protein 2 n=1 Tax=Streptomyces globosus TaxID=68209 RepID=A0A344U0Y0_9ACTN|nr:NAD(P)/FAD-dependent oxidoreductase [Streptomyces globosus]AXE24551.1 NAD(P)/FAD-dependent oxidoreductase [Streptomyces globosus]
MPDPDAVVIGAGPNGLVAANLLADAGWRVVVCEAAPEPGGAVRSDRGLDPSYVHDLFSAFYPLAAASPVIRRLGLERHGLRWSRAPAAVAHPLTDGRCAVLGSGAADTAASLERFAPGDGAAWHRMYGMWDLVRDDLLDCLFTPFPPARAGLRLAARLGYTRALHLARTLLLPARRFGEEEFDGEGGRLLIAGNALHADLGPESALGGGFGWLMCMLGQTYGFPVPQGGAQALTGALVGRLAARGGVLHCGRAVTEVLVHRGRAAAVRTADGTLIRARRAVLADVPAPLLYERLLAPENVPDRIRAALRRFQWDFATFKVDWALSRPIPWRAEGPASAGTVHLADGLDELTLWSAQIAMHRVPGDPFTVLGQMTTADAARSPAGTESAWAYTHVPQSATGDAGGDGITGRWDEREKDAFARRIEDQVERYAPGFRDAVRGRRILAPPDLERLNPALVGGSVNQGTTSLHQQLVFRPLPGTGRPTTPVRGLYLASATAHPGGGVHGAPGANAARTALRALRPLRGPRRRPRTS